MSSENIPVDIEFILNNVNLEDEAAKMRKGITDVGITVEKVADSIEDSMGGAFTNAGKQADMLNSKLKNSAGGVNTYSKQMGQLSYSVQQVARELPNLAISPQLFIMAISNNLPILQEQIMKTKAANAALRAEGKAGVPVYKQIAKSLLSWQTALIAGISILTMYGPEIGNWIRNVLSMRDATALTRKEIKGLTDDLADNIGSDMSKLNQLFDVLNKAKEGTNEYNAAKTEIINSYGKYLTGLNNEITALKDVEGAYRAITTAIIEQSRQKSLNTIREKETADVVKTQFEEYGKIREQFETKYGDQVGGLKFDQFRQELESAKGLSDEMKEIIAGFEYTETYSAGTSTGGAVQQYTAQVNQVQDSIDKIAEAQENAASKIADAEQLIGSIYGDNTEAVKSLIAEQELLLKQARLMPESTEAEITAKNKKIEAIQNEIKRLQELGKAQKPTAGTEDDEYYKQLQKKRDEYEKYTLAISMYGQQWADDNFKLLLKDGENFQAYLDGQVEQFRGSRERMIAIARLAQQEFGINLNTIQGKEATGVTSEVSNTTTESTKQLAALDGWYQKLNKTLIQLNKEVFNKEDWQSTGNALLDTAYMLDDVGNRIGEIDGDLGQLVSDVAVATQDLGNLVTGIASDNIFQAISGGVGLFADAFKVFGQPDELSESVLRQYENLMAAMDDVIDKQRELLSVMAGEEAAAQGETARELLEKQIEATRKLAKEYADSGSGWFSSSHGTELRETLEKYTSELATLGIDVGSLGDRAKGFFDLSPETLQTLKEEIPELWAKIDDRTREYVETIISAADEIQALENQLNEVLTTISFESAKDSLKDFLLEADTTMADIADNFEKYMKQAIVGVIIDSTLKDRIQDWYNLFAENMSDSVLSESEKNDLQTLYETIYQDALNMRDAAYEAAGISPDIGQEEGISGIARSITEETGSLLVGQFMAMRVDIKSLVTQLAENGDITAQRLLYLKNIQDNTGNTVSRLDDVKAELETMNQTLKTGLGA